MPDHDATRLAPGLLVAVPQLADPNFVRTVIYLIALNDEGAFGLILNRPAEIDLDDVCSELGIASPGPRPVFVGGPVDTSRGFLLHGGGLKDGSETVEPGIHISGAPDVLENVVVGSDPYRLFLGYAGWGPGQLEQELAAGAWLVAPSGPAYIFNGGQDDLWARVLRDAGIDPGTIGVGGSGEVN